MTIKDLNLSTEDLLKIKELLERSGWVFDSEEDLLNEDDFHITDSVAEMLLWKFEGGEDIYQFAKACDTTIENLMKSGCKTLGEFLLCDDCVEVVIDGRSKWIKFKI